jgi:signal transduction histidine kinase/ligand-binding sensor domain-containing protein
MRQKISALWVAALFAILLQNWLGAQPRDLVFYHLTKTQGFNPSTGTTVFRDSKGFLWLGTFQGAVKFDGKNFIDVTSQSKVSRGKHIISIFESSNGSFWLGGLNSQLVHYVPALDSFEVYDIKVKLPELKEDIVGMRVYAELPNGELVVSLSDISHAVFNPKTNQAFLLKPRNASCTKLFVSPYGAYAKKQVYYSPTSDGSWVYKGILDANNNLTWIDSTRLNVPETVAAYAFTDAHTLWYVAGGALVETDFKAQKISRHFAANNKPLLSGDNARPVIDNAGNIWIGAINGAYQFDAKKRQLINYHEHVEGDKYSIQGTSEAIYADADNNVYFFFFGKGVSYCNLNSFKFEHVLTASETKKFEANNFVRGLATDHNGQIYCSVERGGLLVLDTNYRIKKMLFASQDWSVEDCLTDHTGKVWFGSDKLQSFDPQINKLMQHTWAGGSIYTLYELRDGRILIGSYDNAWMFEPQTNKIYRLEGIDERAVYTSFYELPSGQLLACARDLSVRLYQPKGDDYTLLKVIKENVYVKHTIQQNDTLLLMATTNGLYQYNINRQKMLPLDGVNRQMPDTYCYAIQKSKAGFYFVSTNNGLFRWHPQTNKTKSFGLEFGLQDLEFNSRAFTQAKNGDLLFGGVNGINVVPTGNFTPKPMPAPIVQFLALKADNNVVSQDKTLLKNSTQKIPVGADALNINYSVIDFYSSGKTRVRYRLLGYFSQWIETDYTGNIFFPNVPPGSYELQLMATNSEGKWVGQPASLFLKLNQYWYKTWWAKVLGLLVLATAFVLFVRMFELRKLEKKQAALEKELAVQRERERITEDLHDDVGSTLSSIHIFGDVAQQLWQKEPEKSREMVANMSTQSRQLMQRMSDIVWSLRVSEDEAGSFSQRLRSYFQELLQAKEIILDFDIDATALTEIKNPAAKKNLLLICKEALNNIVKYSQATRVQIILTDCKQGLCLIIEDNGQGFDSTQTTQGNGLRNIKNRCAQLNGTCTIQAETSKGCAIICTFPLAIIRYSAGGTSA